jgi:hypothetical protein
LKKKVILKKKTKKNKKGKSWEKMQKKEEGMHRGLQL